MKFTKLLLSSAFVIASTLGLAVPADAGHRHPVIEAAQQYRDTVRDFERIVFRTPAMGHTQRQAADRLELQASRVLSRAHDYRRPDRLRAEFEQAKLLETHAESVVFANHSCPSRVVLAPIWQAVLATCEQLETQLCALERSVVVPPRPDCWTPPTHPYLNAPSTGHSYGPTLNYQPSGYMRPWSPPSPYLNSNDHTNDHLGDHMDYHSNYPMESRTYRRQDVGSAVIGALLSRMMQP
jgi:hypothetical protein